MLYRTLSMFNIPIANSISFSFQKINISFSNAARDSFLNSLCYFYPQLVTMALFDKDDPISEKIEIAQTLLQHLAPAHFAPGKPGGRNLNR